uniref:Membrane fusion protein (MFP) family protein n=1 Tax=Magnetococcus massalia (strain MO-1) TaxID=451514 RepID=A0A1S7LPK4_MAGMO|nr:Type I secretion membrane fusion protein, HlyD family [Candidatus Magnetococcus massalia]
MGTWSHDAFADARLTARSSRVGGVSHVLLWSVAAFFAIALYWASQAEVVEATSGMGKVIPSGQVKRVQSLDPGILQERKVNQGDVVTRDDVLLKLDQTQFLSNFRENTSRMQALEGRVARLLAEATGQESFTPPSDLIERNPGIVANETALFKRRQHTLKNNLSIRQQQVTQRQAELEELKESRTQLGRQLKLTQRELKITRPMVKQGVMSEVELLRLDREHSKITGDLAQLRHAVPRAASALEEARSKVDEAQLGFRSQAQEDLNEARNELSRLQEAMTGLKDRVVRTTIRAPVDGTVIRVHVNTVGQVIQSGVTLVEIMPQEDSLMVEARIDPKDIAFLHPGQRAMVKLTAYDFSIYGGLEGELTHISADAITDENGQTAYLVQVRTHEKFIQKGDKKLPIIPGMVASVDVITGKKTILDYLLKPILKARDNALRER